MKPEISTVDNCHCMNNQGVKQPDRVFAVRRNSYHEPVRQMVGRIAGGEVIFVGRRDWQLGKLDRATGKQQSVRVNNRRDYELFEIAKAAIELRAAVRGMRDRLIADLGM